MKVNFNYNDPQAGDPVYFEQVFAEKPGGGLVVNPAADLPATSPVGVNGQGRLEAFKCYRLYAAAESGDTSIKIAKGSGIAQGDVVATGKKAVAVTAVDTSSEDYDVATMSLGVALPAGKVLYEAAAASASAAVPKLTPVYVLGAPVHAGEGDQLVKLVNGANLRRQTANLSDELAAMIPGIALV